MDVPGAFRSSPPPPRGFSPPPPPKSLLISLAEWGNLIEKMTTAWESNSKFLPEAKGAQTRVFSHSGNYKMGISLMKE